MQIVVDKQIINYEKHGNGNKPLLVLHGWRQSLNDWRFLTINSNLLNTHAIYLIDLPGFGKSPIPNEALSVYKYADLMINFCQKMGLGSIDFISHSFGGRVGIVLASQTKLVDKLVLVDTGGIESRKELVTWLKIGLAKLLKPFKFFIPKAVINKFSSDDYQNATNPVIKQIFIDSVNTDLLHLASNIKSETLIIWGINDSVVPIKHGQIWRDKITNATLRIAWDSGHNPHYDEPDFVFNLINNFLNPND